MSLPKERRKHPRVFAHIPIKIQQEDGDMVTETKNISRCGVYCKVSQYVKPMTKLKINFLLPLKTGSKKATKNISCEGIVVRSEPVAGEKSYNAAIFFNDISQKDSDLIAEYVHFHLENDTGD